MNKQCIVPGCREQADGYSTKCGGHKTRERRHGDARQTPVTARELRPYVARIEKRVKANPDSPAWAVLDARWGRIVESCRTVLAARDRGVAGNMHEWHAASEVIKLEQTEGGRRVAAVALAMSAFWFEHKHRFATAKAYQFQLVRRVRGQSAVNRGVSWDHKRQQTRTVYREMPPKATELLASWLDAAYGSAGVQLAVLEEEARTREAKDLDAAIQVLR
ncbi:hypothetical protein ACFJGW_20695 [Burkholderiaceae bacterium UC74_6]